MTATLTHLLHHLRVLAAPPDTTNSDVALLDRFAHHRDAEAFAALVARHGPMVLGVCWRVLGDHHAAEDAFQATFLILVRRAGALTSPAALAGWLYGVAYRVARKARRGNARRLEHRSIPETAEPPDPRSDPLAELSARELLAVLEQEIQRLPQAYRLPVVLCCLEGLSQEGAAQRLGCTAGSVRGRLERGRRRLHEQLTKRGLTLAAALAASAVAQASVALPAPLAEATVRAAQACAAGTTSVAGAAPIHVLALADGVARTMGWMRMKTVAVLLVVGVGLGLGMVRYLDAAEREKAALRQAELAPLAARGADNDIKDGAPPPQADKPLPPATDKPAKEPAQKAGPTPADLIRAMTSTKPWPNENYPVLPTLSTAMRGLVANEIAGSEVIRAAYTKLDAGQATGATWIEGVDELEKAEAVWCLASCLCHPSTDVQLRVLRALERTKDKRAVPFLLLYAEIVAVLVKGSENATIHGIVQTSVAQTLSSLTGVRMTVKGQNPEELLRGVRLWRRWLCDQKE